MPKKKKPPKKRAAPSSDPNVAAFDVVARLTQRTEDRPAVAKKKPTKKLAAPSGPA